MVAGQFDGFSAQALGFLQELHERDSKSWFEEHRPHYEQQLLTPFRALVEALSPVMLQIDKEFETRPVIGKTLSRLHRDTRFSHDKSRYRDRMWLVFKRHSKEWTDAPAYFFEISPTVFRYGLGYYCASRTTLDLLREYMLDNPRSFLKSVGCVQPPFELVGEKYKRLLKKDLPPDIDTWYHRKGMAVLANRDDLSSLYRADLAEQLIQGFQQLAPLYDLWMQIEQQKRRAPE